MYTYRRVFFTFLPCSLNSSVPFRWALSSWLFTRTLPHSPLTRKQCASKRSSVVAVFLSPVHPSPREGFSTTRLGVCVAVYLLASIGTFVHRGSKPSVPWIAGPVNCPLPRAAKEKNGAFAMERQLQAGILHQ